MKATTVATLFAIIGTTTSFNAQPNYGRHSHPNTASYNSLRDMAAYPETFESNGFGRGGGANAGGFDDGNWRTNAGYSQGPGGYRDMETNPYYDEGWSQSARHSRGGGPMMMGGGGGMPPHRRSADGFDPFGAYSPAMGMSRSDRRMDQGDLFMNSNAMGMRSDRTMRGFTYDGRNRDYGMDGRRGGEYGMESMGMMFEDPEFGPPGMMGGMDDMGMMGGGGMGMGGGMGRMGP
eukprot:CAMPEP_0201690768 /NCGR_PEP_ID=MMETSP0578-20130828/4102_1 /ASSEMBLY_ACC=CAM_ASM_000663 /TAXON_ID=267565 /ORGANISM="Skeletonema grethea, Strain CCMP 1804" /LENGTH=233 /DNA_ID=CAMNT_0048175819 /DNA_START=27 /DNA_END=728 /DNA_ORIENTATION=-